MVRSERSRWAKMYPPTVAEVLCSARSPWIAPMRSWDLLFDGLPGIERFVPRIEYILFEEMRCEGPNRARRNVAEASTAIAQAQTAAEAKQWLDHSQEWLRGPEQEQDLHECLQWIKKTVLR